MPHNFDQKPSYEELENLHKNLQEKATRFVLVKQDLINTKHSLDCELSRFRAIQKFTENGLKVQTLDELTTITLESFIEAFEFELCIFLKYQDGQNTVQLIGEFGLNDPPETLQFSPNWIEQKESQILESDHAILQRWKELELFQGIICPFYDNEGGLYGLILGGNSMASHEYYEPIQDGIAPSFTVMVHQTGALWLNYKLNENIRKRNQELVQLTNAYSRFVPHQFLDLLKKKSILDVNLGDHVQMTMSVLFSDIRNFTTLSEKMPPEENFQFINTYLNLMGPIVRECNGFIDKYIGDAVMALFEDPKDAVQASVIMLQQLMVYNQTRIEQNSTPITIGIGVNTGSLMLGTIGESDRMEGTVISDAVNVAARLESMTKIYGASLLISETTIQELGLKSQYQFRKIDKVVVKGKSETFDVFEVLDGLEEEQRHLKVSTLATFQEGLHLYQSGELEQSCLLFEQCFEQNPKDKVFDVYIQRCQQYIQSGISKSWDGVTHLQTK
jgi:class 3 adenylate cyclase